MDVPSVDGVAGESGKEGMMGEPDEDGVWEERGILGGDGVKRPFGMKENQLSMKYKWNIICDFTPICIDSSTAIVIVTSISNCIVTASPTSNSTTWDSLPRQWVLGEHRMG